MAHLVNCFECGANVSSEARECPKCNSPIHGYQCRICRKRDKKKNLHPYNWTIGKPRVGYSCLWDTDYDCQPEKQEKCSLNGTGCYRLAHSGCLEKVINEYGYEKYYIYKCPACEKESSQYGSCQNCGHPSMKELTERCNSCQLLVRHGAAFVYKEKEGYERYQYYHKICYDYSGCSKTCFIATALYGEDSSKVRMLCFFRDEYLSASSLGRAFIALYVRFSPPLARAIAKKSLLRTLVRYCIVAPALLFTEKFLAYAGRKEKLKQ